MVKLLRYILYQEKKREKRFVFLPANLAGGLEGGGGESHTTTTWLATEGSLTSSLSPFIIYMSVRTTVSWSVFPFCVINFFFFYTRRSWCRDTASTRKMKSNEMTRESRSWRSEVRRHSLLRSRDPMYTTSMKSLIFFFF